MKTSLTIGLAALVTSTLFAADSSPKDDVMAAVKRLEQKPNYSWISTPVVPDDAPFKPSPTEGKTEKGGITLMTTSMMENKLRIVMKGEKGAATDQEGKWKSFSELEKEEGPGRFIALMARDNKVPAKEAAQLVPLARELKKDGDVYSGDLTEAGAKELQAFRPPEGDPPTVNNAKGSVKFWLSNGDLTKYEFKLKGNINFNGNEIVNDRNTTVQIKDVGNTKVMLSDEARKKVE